MTKRVLSLMPTNPKKIYAALWPLITGISGYILALSLYRSIAVSMRAETGFSPDFLFGIFSVLFAVGAFVFQGKLKMYRFPVCIFVMLLSYTAVLKLSIGNMLLIYLLISSLPMAVVGMIFTRGITLTVLSPIIYSALNAIGGVIGWILFSGLLQFAGVNALYVLGTGILSYLIIEAELQTEFKTKIAGMISITIMALAFWPGLDFHIEKHRKIRNSELYQYVQNNYNLIFSRWSYISYLEIFSNSKSTLVLYNYNINTSWNKNDRGALGTLLPELVIPGKIALIGCGAGKGLSALIDADVKSEIWCVDIEADMIEEFKRHPEFNGSVFEHPGVIVKAADGREFLVRNQNFDSIVYEYVQSALGSEHLDAGEIITRRHLYSFEGLTTALKALKPDGAILIFASNVWNDLISQSLEDLGACGVGYSMIWHHEMEDGLIEKEADELVVITKNSFKLESLKSRVEELLNDFKTADGKVYLDSYDVLEVGNASGIKDDKPWLAGERIGSKALNRGTYILLFILLMMLLFKKSRRWLPYVLVGLAWEWGMQNVLFMGRFAGNTPLQSSGMFFIALSVGTFLGSLMVYKGTNRDATHLWLIVALIFIPFLNYSEMILLSKIKNNLVEAFVFVVLMSSLWGIPFAYLIHKVSLSRGLWIEKRFKNAIAAEALGIAMGLIFFRWSIIKVGGEMSSLYGSIIWLATILLILYITGFVVPVRLKRMKN